MKQFGSVNEVLQFIEKELGGSTPGKPKASHIFLLYALNATGKTRLSKYFQDKYKNKVFCYNAFTEDLFNWNNEDDNYSLKFNPDNLIFKAIKDEGLDRELTNNYQKFTGSKIEPTIHFKKNQITFGIYSGGDAGNDQIKISRSEESIFIWSLFYTVLADVIDTLKNDPSNRLTDFKYFEYIVIDDPVSSIDDTTCVYGVCQDSGVRTNTEITSRRAGCKLPQKMVCV